MDQKVPGSTRRYSLNKNFEKTQPSGNIPLLNSPGPSNFRGVHTLCIQNVSQLSTKFFTYMFWTQNLAVSFVYKTKRSITAKFCVLDV